jgi:hypothetical protein
LLQYSLVVAVVAVQVFAIRDRVAQWRLLRQTEAYLREVIPEVRKVEQVVKLHFLLLEPVVARRKLGRLQQ